MQIDLLTQALGLMRITGSLLLVKPYTPPWAAIMPDQTELRQMFGKDQTTHAVAFHFVQRGGFTLQSANGAQINAQSGDVVVAFDGNAHTIGQGNGAIPVHLRDHIHASPIDESALRAESAPTALICGVFFLRDTTLNPMFASLPPVLHLEQSRLVESGLSLTVPHLLVQEIGHYGYGSDYVIQRLLELMSMDIIRLYVLTESVDRKNWIRGIQDPVLARALYRFHEAPGDAWTVSRLAEEAHLSPSRFAARFTEIVGESCMSYVTKWRLLIARELLRTTENSVEEVAYRVGYNNVPAFTRVFKRYNGATPAHWRRVHAAG